MGSWSQALLLTATMHFLIDAAIRAANILPAALGDVHSRRSAIERIRVVLQRPPLYAAEDKGGAVRCAYFSKVEGVYRYTRWRTTKWVCAVVIGGVLVKNMHPALARGHKD